MDAKLRISSPDIEFLVPGVALRGLDEAGGLAGALWERRSPMGTSAPRPRWPAPHGPSSRGRSRPRMWGRSGPRGARSPQPEGVWSSRASSCTRWAAIHFDRVELHADRGGAGPAGA